MAHTHTQCSSGELQHLMDSHLYEEFGSHCLPSVAQFLKIYSLFVVTCTGFTISQTAKSRA